MTAGLSTGDSDDAVALGGLVDTVALYRTPDIAGGVKIEIVGRLNALLGEGADPDGVTGSRGISRAAAGRCPPRHG